MSSRDTRRAYEIIENWEARHWGEVMRVHRATEARRKDTDREVLARRALDWLKAQTSVAPSVFAGWSQDDLERTADAIAGLILGARR